MKKIFTLFAMGAAALSMAAANETQFFVGASVDELQPVANGAKVEMPMEIEMEMFYNQDAHLWLGAEKGADLDVTVTTDGQGVQVCYWGNCASVSQGETFAKSFNMGDYATQKEEDGYMYMNMQIHACLMATEAPSKDVSVTVDVHDYDTDKDVSVTVIMLASTEAGISSAVVNKDSVKLINSNTLVYNVSKASTLSVYGITGSLAAKYAINGTGSISLNNLPKGIYLYSDGNHKGKFVIR